MITESIRAYRRTRIGGSDVAAILGRSPYAGPATIANRIIGSAEKNPRYRAVFEFGNRNEHEVARLFSDNHPEFILVSALDMVRQGIIDDLPGFTAKVIDLGDAVTFCHRDYDFLLYNVDYFILSRSAPVWGVLEVKTSSEYASGAWQPSGIVDGCPSHYLDQPRYYQNGLGGHFSYLACRLGNSDYREYPISSYSPEDGEQTFAYLARWFENHIIAGALIMPTMCDKGNITPIGETVTANAVQMKILQRHIELADSIKRLKEEYEPLDNELKGLAANGSLVDKNGEVLFSTKSNNNLEFDVDRFQRERPELYAEYLIPVSRTRTTRGSGYTNYNEHSETPTEWEIGNVV